MSGILILKLGIFIVCLPFLCGLSAAERERCEGGSFSVVKGYVYGWIFMFALFEVLCVPYTVLQKHFQSLAQVYTICVTVMAAVSFVLFAVSRKRTGRQRAADKRREPELPASKDKKGKKLCMLLWGIVILLIMAQMGYLIFYQHLDGDDSYYIAESVLTQYFDTMFQRDAYTGMPMGLDVRHALSANPVFITWLSEMCGVHPAVLAHTVLAPVFLMLMYCIYAMTGQAFLKKYRSYVPVFLLFINLWYLWGNVSIYTAETFMYTRTWQGKAMFSNLILPLVVYMLYEAITEGRKIQWVMLTLLSVAGVFVTTAAVYLIPLVYGTVGLGQWIRGKSFRPCFYLMLCCIPCLLFGVIYRYLLAVWR